MQQIPVRALFALAALPALAWSQGSGLTDGQLVLLDPGLNGSSSSDGGIALVDPVSGAFTKPYAFAATSTRPDGICYDPFRDRLVFVAQLVGSAGLELLAGDAYGNAVPLGFPNLNFQALAPTGDGRIYCRADTAPSDAIRILDAQNQVTFLEDGNGAPFTIPNNSAWGHLEYDAGTHSLLLASQGFVAPCGITSAVTVRRYDLSPDGRDVVGETCIQFDVDPGASQTAVGLTRIDAGSFLLTVDTNTGLAKPRMLRLQVQPLSIVPFASSEYFSAGATNAGAYSSLRGEAVVYDTFVDVLRAFAPGASGEGVVVTAQGPISESSGGSGQTATLIEVRGAPQPTLSAFGDDLISVASGGTQLLLVDLGPQAANQVQWMLGSVSGTAPGLPLGGVTLPLAFDAYATFLLSNPNTPPLTNSLSLLDGSGQALASFSAPGPLAPTLVGVTVWHAAVVLSPALEVSAVTNAVSATFVP